MLDLTFRALHVFLDLLWIGSIAAVGWLLASAHRAPSPEKGAVAAELAAGVYQRVSTPAFLGAFAAGLVRVLQNPSYFMKAHWFHGKLTLALAVIALHHVLGAKAKKAAAAGATDPSQVAPLAKVGVMLTPALVLCAFVVVVLVVFKEALVP